MRLLYPMYFLLIGLCSSTLFTPSFFSNDIEDAPNTMQASSVLVTTFTAPADICIDAGIQTGLSGGLPTGGVYDGPGVTDDGNGMTYSFDPAAAGAGVHTLSYTESGSPASDDVEVFAAGTGSFTGLPDLTIDAGIQSGLGGGLPPPGIYSGPGVTDDGNGLTYSFDPVTAGAGTHTLTYAGTGSGTCLGPFMDIVNVLPVFTALPDLSVNAGIQTGLSDGLPTGGVYSGPGVTDDGNGMTYTFDPAAAGVGVHTLTYTINGLSATDDVEVLNLLPPAFSKVFSPATIGPGSTTTLTFTIDNTASANGVINLDFTDNLPAGVVIATPANVVNGCGLGTVTAPDGGTTISLTGGDLNSFSSCTISVDVTSSTAGTHVNTTGDLTSSSGNSGTATANLTVATDRPGFSKSFSPNPIDLGARSTLTFTIDNTENTGDMLSLNFTDNLPPGMVIATPPNIAISCTGGTLTANPGSTVITYDYPFTFPALAAGASCTISVDVTGTDVGTHNNLTGELSGVNASFATVFCGKASAALEVSVPQDIHIQKSFNPNPAAPGGTTNLDFTITNFNRDFPATNISFTDDLSTVLAGLTAIGTPINGLCGSGSTLTGPTMLSFSGGYLAPEASCTFSVPLSVPGGAASGSYPNITGSVTAMIDGVLTTGNMATEDLFIAEVPTFTKTFLNDPIVAGGTTTLEFTITNNSSTSPLTNISFTDNITAFLGGATITSLPVAGSCGASSVFSSPVIISDIFFQMTGGEIAAGGSCTFSIDLLIPTNVGSGIYTNTTGYLSATLDGTILTANPATDDLEVLAIPQLSKSFTDDPVDEGSIVNLEFTITYDEFATVDATGVSFTDDLNAVIPGLAAVGLPINDICGTGSQISGTTNLSFTGGTMSPGDVCTFSVPVQVPAGTAPGNYTNTTSAITATVGGQSATGNVATDVLTIGGLTLTKEFTDDPVIPGDLVNLRFTIENTTAFDATSIVFTDNLGGVLPGLVAEAPLPTMPCGATNVIFGTNLLIFINGEVLAGTSCSFDVNVRIPPGSVSGTYGNVTSNLTATLNGTPLVLPPAVDQLIVNDNLLQLTKTFTDDPVIPGNTVTVEYTLTNLDPVNAASNIAFTNDFDALLTGLQATGLPMSVCGGTVSGTGLLSFTGGSLAAGASCTFSVTLQTPANVSANSFTCTTSGVTGDISGFPVIGDPASDNLDFLLVDFAKSFAGSVESGTSGTLTFTITNNDASNAINTIQFSDDLSAMASGITASGLPMTEFCGTGSTLTGMSTLLFSGGNLGPGESCSFDVTIDVPCSVGAGTYLNTTSTLTAFGSMGQLLETAPATDNLTVTAPNLGVTFTAPADLCIDAGVQAGLGGGAPPQGTLVGDVGLYSGPGVTDDGNGMTYSFDPASAGAGVHTLTYTYTNDNGCMESATDDIEVFTLPTVTFTALADMCIDAGVQTGLGSGSPTGGVYSGPGVTDDANGMTYSFDPVAAGIGAHTLTYDYTDTNGCSGSATDDVEVFAVPTVMFTAPADLCIDAGVQTGLGGGTPTGGVYSGAGVTDDGNGMTYSFDPASAGAGTHTLTYDYTDSNGCSGSASDDVEVFALPVVLFTAPADLCIDAGVQAGLGGATPAGGVYSGPGVTDDSNGMTYSFDPATAGVGVHTLFYNYTDTNGCSGSGSDMVEVFSLPTVTFTAPADLCIDAGIQAGLGGATPTGGVYSGPGVTDDSNGMTYSFDPATAGVGVHTLFYNYTDTNGCSGSGSDMVEVFSLPIVTFTAPADLCIDAGIQAGLGGGTPTGGVYSGAGVTDDGIGMTYSFDPASAGAGTHTLTYDYTDSNGCSVSASDDVEVFALPVILFTAPADLCIDAGVQAGLGGATPTGGVYSGPGVTDDSNGMTYSFDPASAGAGTHTLTYDYTDTNGCSGSGSDMVEVFSLPTVTFTAPADLCIDAGVQAGLGGGTPTGGVYSGSGVTDDGNGMTYSFDPATAGAGTHTLTYDFTDGNGCSASASDDVEVFALPNVMFTAPADLCIDAGIQAGLGGGTPTGGVYSGAGVTDDGNGMTYSFDPASAGAGTHTLTYDYTDSNGCSASASDDVEVFALPVILFTAPADLCIDAGVQAGLGGATPTGGVYSGPGVTDDSNGMTYSFDPATAGVGVHTLSYDFTDSNGCSASATDDVEVFALPVVAFTAPADLCLDAGVQAGLGGGTPPQDTLTGDMGLYSGPGVTDDGNGMTYSFDPAAAGVGVHTLMYTYTDENGCTSSASDDVEVFAYPVVAFTAPVLDVCIDDPVVMGLGGGTPTGGVYSGTGVVDDNNGMTFSFDPMASAPLGGFITVTYDFTDANGCSGSASDDIFVNPICCQLEVTCPIANDLGTFNCTNLNTIPVCPVDSAAAVAAPYNITIGLSPCGKIEVICTDDITMYDVCAMGGQTINREVIIYDDLNDNQMLDMGEESDTCNYVFTIDEDVTPPMIVCATQTTPIDCPAVPVWVDPMVADACDTAPMVVFNDVTTPACGNTFSVTRTWTATDACGNAATCSATIVVQDITPPTIVCAPQTTPIDCPAVPVWVDPTVTDACDTAPMVVFNDVTTPACGNTFSVTRTWTATDACGNAATCSATIVVQDITPPTIVCAPQTTPIDCPAAPVWEDPMVTDACNPAPMVVFNDVTTPACGNTFSVTRTWTATDACGNAATCSATIVVQDITPPTVVCAPQTTPIDCPAVPVWVDPMVTDACDTAPMVVFNDVTTPACGNTFSVTRTWTATDVCGNAATCSATIVVQDITPPTVVCAPQTTPIECPAVPVWVDPMVTDACDTAPMVVFNDVTTPACGNTFSVTRTWTATDACGNAATCSATIVVQDITAPVITCPADITIECDESTAPANTGSATATDACDPAPVIAFTDVSTQTATSCGQFQYSITRTWTATDACSNASNCVQVITVEDTTAPVITCPVNITIECTESTDPSNTGSATALDNCDPAPVVVYTETSTQGTEGCSKYQYTITRAWNATDACDNTSYCAQTINVVDTTPPVISCPPSQTLTCFEGIPDPYNTGAAFVAAGGTISDNCTASLSEFTIFSVNSDNGGTNCPGDVRILVRTYTIADACGNTSSCEQTFTYIESAQGPVITSILPTCFKFCASLANPMESDITYTTDCSFGATVDITGPEISGGLANCPGTAYTYTYTVTDACGRTSTPVTRDFVIGNDAPTVVCPATNLILECGDPNNQSYIDTHLANVSANTSCGLGYTITHFPQNFNLDNTCGTATVVTFTVTDACDRTATCTTTVALQDNLPPTFTVVPPPICDVINCDADVDYWYDHWVNYMLNGLAAEDVCGTVVNITASNTPLNTDCPGGTAETVVTFTATDNCNNQATMTGVFTVEAVPTSLNIFGVVATEELETVEYVNVTLEGNGTVLETFQTGSDGIYGFNDLLESQNYSVTPSLDEKPLNGVSSFDLVLITKHILEIQPLDSPYKIIAADANKSGSVTSLDLLELRKLILHINETFSNNTAWRFVEAAFVFPEPTNPFATIFPEAVTINGLTQSEQHDFVGVKVGDVNGSAVANVLAEADDRTFVDDLVFSISDQVLKAGQSYEVTFNSDNFNAIHGYQFSLNFDQNALEFVSIAEGELININDSNFGLSLLKKGVITTSWTNQKGHSLMDGTPLFHMTFRAKADGLLSEVINVSSGYTKAEAYNGNLDLMDVKFRFEGGEVLTKEVILHQNQPNPFMKSTVIGFELPDEAFATMGIYNLSGHLLKEIKGDFEKGYNHVEVDKDELGASGLLYYRLITKGFEGTMKMMVLE